MIRVNANKLGSEFQNHTMAQRKRILNEMHNQLKKYINRMPQALVC